MAKYLVTGGAGFIGSHLCEQLVNEGHEVIVYDDLSTGKLENIAHIKNVKLIEASVLDDEKLKEHLRSADGCFHMAAIVSLDMAYKNWYEVSQVNLVGTLNVFNAVKHINKARKFPLIFPSSCSVYGDNQNLPLNENEKIIPISSYAADKYASEVYARVLCGIYELDILAFRIFNVYGPRQSEQSQYAGVISAFFKAAQLKQPLRIYGDGEQTRDFVFVSDVVKYMARAMARCWKGYCCYNISSNTQITINKLAEKIKNLYPYDLEVIHEAPRPGDVKYSCGDNHKLLKDFSIGEQLRLDNGLEMMKIYKQQQDL